MNMAAKALVWLGVIFVGVWLLSVVAIFIKALRPGALFQRGDRELPWSKRFILAVCALPLIFVLAAGVLVNTVVFVAGLCWQRLRHKPVPAEPSPPSKREDRAA